MHLVDHRVLGALGVGVLYMGLCGAVFWIWREPLLRFFLMLEQTPATMAVDLAPHIIRVGGRVMICAAVFQVFDAVGIVLSGALRGAGETLWPMAVSALLIATVALAGGAAMRAAFPAPGEPGRVDRPGGLRDRAGPGHVRSLPYGQVAADRPAQPVVGFGTQGHTRNCAGMSDGADAPAVALADVDTFRCRSIMSR